MHLFIEASKIIIRSEHFMGRVKRIWYLSPMRAAKVQASLRIRAVSPEPPLLAHRSSESRGTFRQKARSLAPLNDWACAVKICHDGMLEDTNSLDLAHFMCVTIFHVPKNNIYRQIVKKSFIWLSHFQIKYGCVKSSLLFHISGYDTDYRHSQGLCSTQGNRKWCQSHVHCLSIPTAPHHLISL